MQTLKTAVIGLGFMGQQHARILYEMPNAELIGVYDIDENHARNMAEQFNTNAYSDLEALLDEKNLEAVFICTSDNQHLDIAYKVADYGKDIFIEKPLADTLEDSKNIINKVNDSNIRMLVGHTLRWDPRYYLAKESVQQGDIGEHVHIYARRSNSYENGKRLKGRTSVVKFLGVHDLDAIEWVTGDRIEEVYAIEARKRLTEFDIGDVIITTLKFASGAIGSYETSWVLPHVDIDAKLDITGSEGALNIDIVDQTIKVYKNQDKISYPDPLSGVELYGKQTGIIKEEVSSFVNGILEGKEFPISLEEAYRAVKIVEAIEESIKTRQSVKISE